MKIYSVNCLPDTVILGKQTEQGVHEVRIDCAPWLARWPELAISVWVTPPGGSAAYPAVTHMEGDLLVWTVSLADTAAPGSGYMEVMGTAEGKKKLSATAVTRILGTTTDTTSEPPEAAQAWVDAVANNAGRAEKAAADAEASAGAAETTRQEAQAQSEAALNAQHAAEAAQAGAEAAAAKAESIRSSVNALYVSATQIYNDGVIPARNEAVAAAKDATENATATAADAVKAETARDTATQAAERAELEASKASEKVNEALTAAKESGEFDGRRGTGILAITSNLSKLNHSDGSVSYVAHYETVKAEAGVEEVLVGDILLKDSLLYTVYRIGKPSAYCRAPVDIKGAIGEDGYSPTVTLTRQSSGVQIEVQNKDGKQTAMVYDGLDGTGGESVSFKVDETLTLENGILSVNTTDKVEQDNTQPITSAGVFAEIGNINALLSTI